MLTMLADRSAALNLQCANLRYRIDVAGEGLAEMDLQQGRAFRLVVGFRFGVLNQRAHAYFDLADPSYGISWAQILGEGLLRFDRRSTEREEETERGRMTQAPAPLSDSTVNYRESLKIFPSDRRTVRRVGGEARGHSEQRARA
jgi:hypothetical protein